MSQNGRRGTEVPYTNNTNTRWRKKLEKLADPDLPEKEAQKWLDTVTVGAYKSLSRGNDPILSSITAIARKAGLLSASGRNVRLISMVLKSKGVPTGSTPHSEYKTRSGKRRRKKCYSIRALDNKKAISILQNADELNHLRENPITVLGKPTKIIPTTSQLFNSGNFASLGVLILEIRKWRLYSSNWIGLCNSILTADCPVSVYGYERRGVVYYPLDQKEELKAYLATRLKDLGLLVG